ncbi:MAG: FAD-dependent thymidylate synthase [Pseudanabaenaceae cyanobacterium]
MDSVKLIWITPEAERVIAYCARVSNPKNQDNPNIAKLLHYCARHKHWSIFEMASMCVEINTTRAIATQILRHKSFSFQQFSLRYAEAEELTIPEIRRQDPTNRQNSIDDLDPALKEWWQQEVVELYDRIQSLYKTALEKGIAKECARGILPLSTAARLYMAGTIRSWIHYLQVRANPSSGTQKEHYDVACQIKDIFREQMPEIYRATLEDLEL